MRHVSFRCLFLAFFAMVPAFVFSQDNRNVLASQINTAEVRITNSSDIAAYHSRLPLSTMLKVTNLDNFRSVEVRVMGRASGSPGDMILLSEEAAQIVGLSGTNQIPVRVDVITGQAAATIPLEPFDNVAEEQPAPRVETEEPQAIAAVSSWEDEEEIEDTYAGFSYEPEPVEPPPPPPPPPPAPAPVAPAPAAPQPPVRTPPPEQQPSPAVTQPPPQPQVVVAPGGSGQPVRVTVNINGRDYIFEIPNDGQTPPRSVSVTPTPPPTTYYIPTIPTPPAASPPPAETTPPSSLGNAATIIPSIPDPNSRAVYRVQVGAFGNRNLARAAFDRLKNAGFDPSYEPYNNLFRVVIPGVRAADIPQVARRLGAAGFTSAWIRKEN